VGAGGALLTLALGLGCGPGEAKAPIPTRPLDERRAIEVIRRAMKKEGVEPGPARDEKLVGSGAPVRIDVGVSGKKYGVAYVTPEDAAQLPEEYRTPPKKDAKIRVPSAGDGTTRVVLLYQENYRYDDLAGESHEQTTITAENALARDVQDFVTWARTQKYE
jgi:hypothetical protein